MSATTQNQSQTAYIEHDPEAIVQFLTYENVAELFQVKPGAVRAWVASGRFPAPIEIGNCKRFELEEIIEYIRTQKGKRR